MNVRWLFLLSLAITSACKPADNSEPSKPPEGPSARNGSAAPIERSEVTPSATAPDASSGAASGSGSAMGSGSGRAGSAIGSGAADGGLCEAYYQGELKLAREEGWKIVNKRDAFLAACGELPAELQRCQGDVDYALAHDEVCSKLIMKHVRQLRALRKLVASV